MSEEMRDLELDDRINSWLESVVIPDDFSVFSDNPEDDNLGRPCMNCSMRGRRTPPNLRKMDIPAFVLRTRSVPGRNVSNRPTSGMQGVSRQQRPERGKGRGRKLMERKDLFSEGTGSNMTSKEAVAVVEMAQLKHMVNSLTNDDFARLRCASSYARGAKNDNERLKEKLMNPPNEVAVSCLICLIEILAGRKLRTYLLDFPLHAVVTTCIAFEADNELRDVLLKKLEKSNIAHVIAYLAANGWLSTSSGEYVCDYLDGTLGISIDIALDMMRTAAGSFSPDELDAYIQSLPTEASIESDGRQANMLDMLIASAVSERNATKGFGKRPKVKRLEITSIDEFPKLSSTVTVKKNINTTSKFKVEEQDSRILSSSGVLSGSEDAPFEHSETTSSTEMPGQHLVIFNLPEISSKDDLRGALSAFGDVTLVVVEGQATKVWFQDPSILEWAEEALNKINPFTGDQDENIKCMVVDPL